ncbi:MAG TPA: UDP-N-acetylmuramoyl-L-alanine--D-glutamate ligase [Candidatus Sulfotelmatobacter sp.]|jgi:UDP-N-acetylmuramoylalanine--D-glutamate ligase|nr:UDP-N-acetylmuramoyl-L-alanine--D-glutamate ligase [Candidatus Sulfotelmatobacter sp.]
MPAVPQLNGKKVAVMGLGKSGTSAARALAVSGASVIAWDDNESARTAATAEGVTIRDLLAEDFATVDLVLWSPGIPHIHPKPHPVAERARAAGVPVVCDVELLAIACPNARFVGITGTNGKSTTTTLIAHILKSAGYEIAVGGNLGTPALDLPLLSDQGIYVLELSSYQLELLDTAAFDVAVMLNLTPDHLSRHGGMEGYFAAKASLFQRLRANGAAVVGVDDTYGQRLAASLPHAVTVSVREPIQGVHAENGMLIDQGARLFDLSGLSILPGRHNWQNACCAYAAARALGLPLDEIVAGLKSYPGLAHRQEWVGTVDGVRYVNDSKATNADAAEKAMLCYRHIYWIIGGQAKEGGIGSLEPLFSRVVKAFLIGEASDAFAAALEGKAAFDRCGTLDVAVAKAREAALADGHKDAVVLLSPACASWDQFKSFEHRGEAFRDLVARLPGKRGAAP